MTAVYTAFELQREAELGTPHIVIQEHLDLTQLGPVSLTSDGGERIVVRNTTLSIRVRSRIPLAHFIALNHLAVVFRCFLPSNQRCGVFVCRATAQLHQVRVAKQVAQRWGMCCQDNVYSL